ncbi:hypothetical protein ACQ4PT_058019 [Festuca glaucescens]
MTKRFLRLQLPDGAMGRHAVTGVQHRQQAGVADNPMNMNGPNPEPATNLRSCGATSGADHAENVAGPSVTVVEPKKSRAFLSLGRNKASPARLVKLNEILSPAQKTLITEWGWGGMMMVKATEMPVDLSMWVLACFDPIRSELAIPGRGTIPVDAASYNKVFGLPNEGLPVRYEMETEPIAFMNEEYNIQGGSAPGFKQWQKRKLVVMIGELCTNISNRLGTFVEQVGDLEQAEDIAKGVCGRVRKRQRPEPFVVVDEDDDDDADDEDYNADGDEDDEDNEDGDDEDDEDDEDGDNEDGASKEHPSNGQHNEDDDFEDRGAHFENTPRRSARRTVSPRNHHVQCVKLAHLRDLRILDGRRVVTPPSFNLGFDSPPKNQEQSTVVAASAGITPTSIRSLGSPIFDEYEDVWSPEMEEEAIALCTKVEMEKGYLRAEADTMGVGHQSEAELQTPTPVAHRVTPSKDASGSNSDAAPVELCERRIIRPAACYKSPYIDFSSKNTYACSADVKEVYDLVTSGAKRNGRGQHKDNTPIIVNFEKFFVSHQELANSMMPCAELDNTVFELGLESIMLRKDKDDKKVVMPLRFMTLLQEYGWKHKDVKKYFAKKDAHLDKKDLVLLPVLENMSEDPTVKVNHYWLLVLNIKDRRFEVLDSMRTINDKKLALLVKNLQATITSLWNEHYPKSRIKLEKFDLSDIFAPKQKTNKDCGVHALMNAEHWTGRSLPNYGGKDISNIRKLMTHTWVTSTHNTIDWRKALKKKGK